MNSFNKTAFKIREKRIFQSKSKYEVILLVINNL